MRNKPVCLTCDELTFDIEIEAEEFEKEEPAKSPSELPERLRVKRTKILK